jgi:lantibiotic biosynthesis protein
MTLSLDDVGSVCSTQGWQPILSGAEAVSARDTVDRIVLALEARAPERALGLQGDASSALALAYCGRPSAAERLDIALRAITDSSVTVSLFAGISGLSWLVHHLTDGDDSNALIKHFDATLLRALEVSAWRGGLDLISGLVGMGVVAAARRDGAANAIADGVLRHLEATVASEQLGITWYVDLDGSGSQSYGSLCHGSVDLGVAHGVPGIIGVLSQFVEADIQRARSLGLLQSAVAWLLGTIPDQRPRFGTRWPAARESSKQLAWCYGDIGVAGVLLTASRVMMAHECARVATALLQHASEALAGKYIPDACFCHGAAGIAHIFNLAFQRTGSTEMRAHARRWILNILRRKMPEQGIGGYRFLKIDQDVPRWASDPTLASGAAGVALVLLAAIEDREPRWQSLFLL